MLGVLYFDIGLATVIWHAWKLFFIKKKDADKVFERLEEDFSVLNVTDDDMRVLLRRIAYAGSLFIAFIIWPYYWWIHFTKAKSGD